MVNLPSYLRSSRSHCLIRKSCRMSSTYLRLCFLQLRSVSGGGGDEEEGRQQRKDGEGEGARSVLDQDSSRVVPQLLSPSDASRYAPLLALARLVLSDRYADYLLILRNLRRYAVGSSLSAGAVLCFEVHSSSSSPAVLFLCVCTLHSPRRDIRTCTVCL